MKGYILLFVAMVMVSYGFTQTNTYQLLDQKLDQPTEQNLKTPHNSGNRSWQTIFSDDFEGAFPSTNWGLFVGAGKASATWGTWTCWSVSGSKSAGCAVVGSAAITCGNNYPDNMEAWMICGPFDLSGGSILDAEINFEYNISSQPGIDNLYCAVSDGGTYIPFAPITGTGSGSQTFKLTSYIGEASVSIAFVFISDLSINAVNGAQIDDVVIRKDVPTGPQDIEIYPPSLVYDENLNNIPSNREESDKIEFNDADKERASYQLFTELTDISLLNSSQKERLGMYQLMQTTDDIMVVTADINLLKLEIPFYLNLFNDEALQVLPTRREIRGNDDFSWFGKFPDRRFDNAILVVNGENVTGTVRVNDELYSIKPLGSGVQALIRIYEENFPDEHSPDYRDPEPGILGDFNIEDYTSGRLDDGSTITLLVAYNALAASQAGDINALIQLAVDETNQSYVHSDIDPRVYLSYKYQTTYTQSGDFTIDLGRFREKDDGFMDEVHEWRDVYGADVCILIVGAGGACGVAAAQPADESTAFCVVGQDCATGYYSFGHEIGHLQGAGHNPEQPIPPAAFPYGHGYLYIPDLWRTIMSYRNEGGPPYCVRKQYWSNPDILFNGDPMGTVHTHDNARVLDETAAMVAAFRHSDTMSFAIKNMGGDPLEVSSISDNKDWLTLTGVPVLPISIPGVGSQNVACEIDWTMVGSTNDVATVTILSDDPVNPSSQILITVKPISVPTDLTLENVTITSGQTLCFDATNIVTLGGGGTTFIVQSGADVNIIAGNKIFMKAGVSINSGADFNASISTSGDYCGDGARNLYLKDEILEEEISMKEELRINVYPNPTTGILVVELQGVEEINNANIEVFDFTGRLLISEFMNNAVRTTLDLNDLKSGIYFVKVHYGDTIEVTKVIKN